MGSGFSAGPFAKPVRRFVNLEMVEIHKCMESVDRMINKRYRDDTYMTRNQFQKCFQLSDALTYSIFRLFDPNGDSRVMSLDVWGAIILASSARIEEKLKLLFELADINEDNFMGPLDCELLMRCASRGFSHLKGIPVPENSLVKKMVDLMFESTVLDLSELGEISTFSFREFFTICDLLQTYMANLGTQATALNIQKLITQRAELIKEIAELESTVEHINYDKSIEEDDVRAMLADRGGDSRLLLLSEEIEEPHEPTQEEIRLAHESRMTAVSRADREAQRTRRMQRALESGKTYVVLDEEQLTADDAAAFTREETGGVISTGMGSVSEGITIRSLIEYEKLLEFRWKSFTPQSTDKLVKLDIDKIEDLFESAGIRLTDVEALQCLTSLHVNQLGRHSLADVLRWFQDKHFSEMVNGPARPSDPAPKQYVLLGKKIKSAFEFLYSNIKTAAQIIEKQRHISDELTLLSKRRSGQPALLQLVETTETNKLNSTALLASWHRRRKLNEMSKLQYSVEFGKDPDIPEEEEKSAVVISPVKNRAAKGKPIKPGGKPELAPDAPKESKATTLKNAMKNIADGLSDWKFQINVEVHTKVSNIHASDASLLDKSDCLRLHPSLFTQADISGHFKIKMEDHLKVLGLSGNPVDDKVNTKEKSGPSKFAPADAADGKKRKDKKVDDSIFCKTAVWLSLLCKKGMSYEQVEILRETAHRTLEGIPYEYRENLYRHTRSQSFLLPPEEGRRGPDYLGERCIPPLAAYDYVVVVALLHEDDIYENIEELFTGSHVAITRALWNLSVSLNIRESFSDLIQASREYDNYDARLFGPQEEEIGEEGMNPIRFAKACRKRKQELQDAAEAASKMSGADLKQVLAEMGLNNGDKSREVLAARAQRAYEYKISLVGSGELSEFGKTVVGRIFDKFDEDKDGGLSLWEMNSLLHAVHTATIPHMKEYQRIMETNDFFGDTNGYLTKLGLCAYYERFGRLADDIAVLGIGSIDELMSGEINFNLTYDPEAVGTLMPLLERHTLAQRYFKKVLNIFSTLHNLTWDAKVDKLSDIFEIFRDLGLSDYLQYLCGGPENFDWMQYAATAPGMISNLIDMMSRFFADGEVGVMREMKIVAADKVPKFSFYNYDWDPVFDKIVHRMLVSFDGGALSDGGEDPDNDTEEDGKGTENGDAHTDGGTDDDGTDDGMLAKSDNGGDEQSITTKMSQLSNAQADKSCLRGFIPPLIPTYNLGRDIKTMFTDAKNALLGLQGAIRVTRKQRELLVRSQREWERGCVILSRMQNDAVASWSIHASAFYDCLRIYPIDFGCVGFGTPEFGGCIAFKGLSFSDLNLPKADGAPCPARKFLFDKIYRALQRKAAALAAIERQKERARLAKEKAEREAREELERQRRMMDPQVFFDEEENALVRKAVKVLDALRDIYIRKKNAIEEERKAKEAELIRLGMIDAPMKKEDEAEYTDIGRAMELHDGQIVVPNAIIRKRVKVYAINNYGAYLHEAQQGEVSGALQLWYDLLELREGRYRLKPLRILRIATIQNNISMLLVEYYINYRKSEASQRRMTEANSIMSFMVDTIHSWLSREAELDIAEAHELAEVEARAKSKGGPRNSSGSKSNERASSAMSKSGADVDDNMSDFNKILDGFFPEEIDVALPDLRKRGLSAVPLIVMLQNYVSFVRHTVALKSYFIESRPATRSNSAVMAAKSSSRDNSPDRYTLKSSMSSRPASPQAVHFGGTDVLVIEHREGKALSEGTSSSFGSPDKVGITDMFAELPKPLRTDFMDYVDFVECMEDSNESVFLRSQSRIHGLISQLTEKEVTELVAKKFSLELTPVFMLPANFFQIVKKERPADRSRNVANIVVNVFPIEMDPERRKEDEDGLGAIAAAIHAHGDRSAIVAEQHVQYGKVLEKREGDELKALSQFEEALSIQLEIGSKLSESCILTMNSLAKLKERMGKHLEALSAYYAVLERYAHLHGKDSQEIADALKNIAACYHTLGRRDTCLLLLKKIRQMEKLLRQNMAFKNKVSKTFIDIYAELATSMAALELFTESEKLTKTCVKLAARFHSKNDSLKYSKQLSTLLTASRCASPEIRSESEDSQNKITRAASMPALENETSSKNQKSSQTEYTPHADEKMNSAEEEDASDIPEIWKELNATSDEVLTRRELRQNQRKAEKDRLKAILEAEEAERKRLRDAMETPEMLAAAAKLARQEVIRKKRERAEAMRNVSIRRRARLYEMINNNQITTYFNAVSNDTEGSAHLNWANQDAVGIVDPFADLDSEPNSRPTTGQTGEPTGHRSNVSGDGQEGSP